MRRQKVKCRVKEEVYIGQEDERGQEIVNIKVVRVVFRTYVVNVMMTKIGLKVYQVVDTQT